MCKLTNTNARGIRVGCKGGTANIVLHESTECLAELKSSLVTQDARLPDCSCSEGSFVEERRSWRCLT